MLKANLHMHSKKDLFEGKKTVDFSPKQGIDEAAKLGFSVLSFTHHEEVFYNKNILDYAKKKNILLIPGVELEIEGKHVLIYNVAQKELDKIKKIEDLVKIKRKNSLIIAAHPFFLKNALGRKLKKKIELFDAIEYSGFFKWFFNFNRKAVKLSKRYNKPIIATSDTHLLKQLDYSYCLVNSKKTIDDFINSVKKGKIKNISKPLPLWLFLKRASAIFHKTER